MGTLVRYSTTIESVTCGACGIPFGLPSNLYQSRRADGKNFYCPNGHFVGWNETTEKRLKRELDEVRDVLASSRRAYADERKQHAATKGKLTKTLKRAAAGVCPFCTRTFQNVQRHIEGQHKAG